MEITMSVQNIKHVVVVMFESRSFDTMLGGLYADGSAPTNFLSTVPYFDGLQTGMANPSSAGDPIFAVTPAGSSTLPDPEPLESFTHVREQLLGTTVGALAMSGFVQSYETTSTTDASQVMQCHSPDQLPVLSTLAREYAVSDAWFASVPSQSWPNRAFAHAGTSNGHVDNGSPPDPFDWQLPTIFNVLHEVGASWAVFSAALVEPSLTLTMFPTLWDAKYRSNFQRFGAFISACQNNTLPQYSFIEPRFLLDPNDQHPPHDVYAGERFLYDIWNALSTSSAWPETLLVITYDGHGGTYDHVLPPTNAVAPDSASNPGDQNFDFASFGVRVPAVVVSPYIAPRTVFRSPNTTPYDHTSILATLRDWLDIPPANMLKSNRVAAAPTLAQLLTLEKPRSDLPAIPAPQSTKFIATNLARPLNALQKSLVSGTARRLGLDPVATLNTTPTRQHAVDFFNKLLSPLDGAVSGNNPTAAVPGAALENDLLAGRRRAILDNDQTTIAGDVLGTQSDAEAFARIAIDTQTKAPFAIGIFGDWGAGKSSFMERMEKQIDVLQGDAHEMQSNAYTNAAVQIKFNAWHYIETNLWASLATQIFDKLEDHLRTKRGGDVLANNLFGKLATPQRLRMESLERVNDARIQLDRAHANLKEVLRDAKKGDARRDISGGKLAGVAISATLENLTPEQQDEVLKAADDLGLPTDITAVRELVTEAQRTRTLLYRNVFVLKSIAKLRLRPLQIFVLVAVVVGSTILGAWAAGELVRILDWQVAKSAARVIGGAAATALGFFTALNSIALKTAEAVAKLGDIAKRIREEITSNTADDRAARREMVAAAERVVASAEEALLLAKQDFQHTSPHALLNKFINEKSSGENYSQHLGLVATIRKDFDQLSQIMCRSDAQTVPLDHYEKETIARYTNVMNREGLQLEESAHPGELRYFDRIVLYIDDLDRCGPDKVAEVLQAIHLLLAFPLFVVVVAVDFRWVSSALRAYYKGQLATEPINGHNIEEFASDVRYRSSTAEPDDYIEKIFQIPYWVRPVDDHAGAALLDAYTKADIAAEPAAETPSNVPPPSGSGIRSDGDSSSLESPPDTPRSEPSSGAAPRPPIEHTVAGQETLSDDSDAKNTSQANDATGTNDTPPRQVEQRVVLQQVEIDFMKQVAFIAGRTPRRLKRFVNCYRVIKATLWDSAPKDWLSAAQPEESVPHYKAVLLQLAFVTGYAASFEHYAIEQAIVSNENLGIQSLIERLEQGKFRGSPGAPEFIRGLKLLMPEHDCTATLARMTLYAPFVARFSFCNPNRLRAISV
jgi:phospholipase C